MKLVYYQTLLMECVDNIETITSLEEEKSDLL